MFQLFKNSKVDTKTNDKKAHNLHLELDNPQLQHQIKWLSIAPDSRSLNFEQLAAQNRKILDTLKHLQTKLNKELNNAQLHASQTTVRQNKNGSDQHKILEEKFKNNQKLIVSLNKDQQSLDSRMAKINAGLESKTTEHKFLLENKLQQTKGEIRKMKLEEHQTEKWLQNHQNLQEFEGTTLHNRLEQQLRVQSIKYVRLLDQYNKSVEKLAMTASIDQIPDHQFQIPQEIYNEDLEKREKQQYKQYEGIVKLCTILQKRNDAQHNKAQRIYNQHLKQLEKLISSLGRADRLISQRQGQIIETRKYIDMLKLKMESGDAISFRDSMRGSQAGITYRNKSYSTVKLGRENTQLRKRVQSFARLLPVKNRNIRE